MENKLAEVVDTTVIMEQNADEKMCSCGNDVVDEMCSLGDADTCRNCRIDVKGTIGIAVRRLKIKEFKTNHRILECGGWSFVFGMMEMYPVGESLSGKIGLWL